MAEGQLKRCFVCKKTDTDDINYGEWESIEDSDLQVHYFCLLLSTGLQQKGADNEGIWGFLEQDIRNFADECASKKCVYCGELSASILCKHGRTKRTKCRKRFHLVCGVEKWCRFQFIDPYTSFCRSHHGIRNTQVRHHDKCMICFELMGAYHPITSIPSCCDRGWLHANCMRKWASSAGLLLICPLCGHQKEDYLDMLKKRGIYIPHRDASWEQQKNAYHELLARASAHPSPADDNERDTDSNVSNITPVEYNPIEATAPVIDLCRESSTSSHSSSANKTHKRRASELNCEQSPPRTQSGGISSHLESNMDALVSVAEFSDNPFKKTTILLARDQPLPGTRRQLSSVFEYPFWSNASAVTIPMVKGEHQQMQQN